MIKNFFWWTKKFRTSKKEILWQIFLVFLLPVFLIQTGIIPIKLRMLVLVLTVSLFLALLIKERWTLEILHIEAKNFKKFILPYILFTAIGIFILVVFSEQTGREEVSRWWSSRHFTYLFLVVSIFQEVAYRGYLIPALRKIIASPILVIIINALIFTYMHSIFGNSTINLLIAFIGGLGFAIMYIKYPNLILITLSHAFLNFFAVLYGFFTVR